MKPKTVITALMIFLIGISIYGCQTAPHISISPSPPINDIPLTPNTNPVPNPTPEANKTVLISNSVVGANNQLAMDLYNRYKINDGNVFFSPFSISSALAMTYEGARGKTAEEMQAVLHLPSSKDDIRREYGTIFSDINSKDRRYKLETANALWVQKDYPLKSEFLNTVAEFYNGKANNVDFVKETEKSRKTINNWVEDKTYDRIKDLIPKGILSPMTRLVLTNAIYFKANWTYKFKKESTYDQDFTLASGNRIKVKMMHQLESFNYGETDDMQILEMPYRGNELSMLVILPKDKEVDLRNLEELKKQMTKEQVQVSLPKFKFETKYFMKEDLQSMGMKLAFSPTDADFSGMTDAEQLYISEVIHKTFVEVQEAGTEAAAATAVVVGTSSAPMEPKEPKIFQADHPFIFLIQETKTGNILFMGRVNDPNK